MRLWRSRLKRSSPKPAVNPGSTSIELGRAGSNILSAVGLPRRTSRSKSAQDIERIETAEANQDQSPSIGSHLWDEALSEVKASNDKDAIELVNQFQRPMDGQLTDMVRNISETMQRQIQDKRGRSSAFVHVEKTVSVLNQFIAVGDVAVSFDPVHTALPWAIVRGVLVTITSKSQLDAHILGAMASVASLLLQCDMYQTLYLTSHCNADGIESAVDALKGSIIRAYVNTLFFLGFVNSQQRRNTALTAPFHLPEAEDKAKSLDESSHQLTRSANDCERFHKLQSNASYQKQFDLIDNLRQSSSYHSMLLESIQQDLILNKLQAAEGAAFDDFSQQSRATCHPGTRLEVLDAVNKWAGDASGPPVFWLQGLAGTGKSTIAQTVAKEQSRENLGASFFFKRGFGDRGTARRFFTTLARQVAHSWPLLAKGVCDAIHENPDIGGKALEAQFRELILRPLTEFTSSTTELKTLVFVVDALDECDPPEDAITLIDLLVNNNHFPSLCLKLFITSRPEHHIISGFYDTDNPRQDLILHRVQEDIVQHDIRVFLAADAQSYREKYNRVEAKKGRESKLPDDWPGEENVQRLAQMATPLFISAATIARMLRDNNWAVSPDEKINHILEYRTRGDEGLSSLYHSVLAHLFIPRHAKNDFITQFRKIVGSVILLASPLSISSLSILLDVERREISWKLNALSSVLDVPSEDAPIRLFHLSFREFLLDKDSFSNNDSCTNLWIEEALVHRELATRCLQLLSASLCNDVCGIQDAGISREDVKSDQMEKSLSPPIVYACLYWASHVEAGGLQIRDEGPEHEFLKTKLLNWIEALAWLGRIQDGMEMIRLLGKLAQKNKCLDMSKLLHDADRFILSFRPAIEATPLQIYCSALVFSPSNSLIQQTFAADMPNFIRQVPQVDPDWSACLQTIELGDGSQAVGLDFVSNEKLIAGNRNGSIKVLDVKTGSHLQEFSTNKDVILAFTVSPDHKLISVGTQFVQLWNLEDGKYLRDWWFLRASHMFSMVPLPTGNHIAMLTRPWTSMEYICIDLNTGEDTKTNLSLSQDRKKESAVLSKDGQLAAQIRPSVVVVFDPHANKILLEFKRTGIKVTKAIFSQDGHSIVMGSSRGLIMLQDLMTGKMEKEFDGQVGKVKALAISKNKEKLAVGGENNFAIAIWDVENLALQCIFTGHTLPIRFLAFSPNEALLASSQDTSTKIWDLSLKVSEGTGMRAAESVIKMASVSTDQVFYLSALGAFEKWDMKAMSTQEYNVPDRCVLDVVFSDYAPIAAIVCIEDIEIWQLSTNCRLQSLQRPYAPLTPHGQQMEQCSVPQIAFLTNGQMISAESANSAPLVPPKSCWSTIEIWDPVTSVCLDRSVSDECVVKSVIASPDSQVVAFVEEAIIIGGGFYRGERRRVRIEDLSTDRHMCTMPIDILSAESAELAAKGTQLILISPQWRVDIYDTSTGIKIHEFSLGSGFLKNTNQSLMHPSFRNRDFVSRPDMRLAEFRETFFKRYWITPDGVWLMDRSRRVMWLPVEHRPTRAIMVQSRLVWACGNRLNTMVLD